MLSRFTLYFDEVAKRGSIRRASEYLNIAPSAVDRQILRMEEKLGVALFDRTSQGLRLTAAGELMIGVVRRWRRDLRNLEVRIDELRGLRRGEVTIALAEGSGELVTRNLLSFGSRYPGIVYRLHIAGSQAVVDMVLRGEVDIGLTFNPPERHELRVERALIYQVGAVVPAGHPLAGRSEITLDECAEYSLVGPDEGHSLRAVLDRAWAANVGGSPRFAASVNSVELIKALVLGGMGVGLLTPIDIVAEAEQGLLHFVPLTGGRIPLSVLSVISASGRQLSTVASLLLQHLALAMRDEPAPHVG
ncbi:LysR family transcriptional regulator [Sphingomonas hengshuiensis]|uniref:LysR family transcriptional regulator n=1 Tax=Sphingomonas hengshuiensis TaxID=1609977 RepID=A0A7U4J6F8_9SPHN|nr:LysR family transcriptional regulator [Sphingomonas hengshuiensis]AJP71118.1 LysR family transcriptional regulator [Sphingomonas hengshuiensis]